MFLPEVLSHRPWSVSKAGTLERCTRQYRYKYIARTREGTSPKSGRVGDAVHAVLEEGLASDNADAVFLHDTFIRHAHAMKLLTAEVEEARAFLDGCAAFIERAAKFKVAQAATHSWVERELAIDEDFKAVEYNDPRAFVRGKLDYSVLTGKKVMMVFDHKTGKPKSALVHHEQLYIYALLVEAHHEEVEGVQPALHFVGEPELQRLGVLSKNYIQENLRPWLESYLNRLAGPIKVIAEHSETASPGKLCAWCPYITTPGCPEGAAHLSKRGRSRDASEPNNL